MSQTLRSQVLIVGAGPVGLTFAMDLAQRGTDVLSGIDVGAGVDPRLFAGAPALLGMAKHGPAWATFSLNPRRCGNVYAIDGRETWLLHNYLKAGEDDFESVDRDWAIREILGVGPDFQYEILSKEDWIGRRLVADRFRDRGIFICGDASHLWIPRAGYGMNACIADATNLSWLLAAHLNGWDTEAALAACLRARAPAHHRAGLALRHEPRAGPVSQVRRRAGRHRRHGRSRHCGARNGRRRTVRAQRAAMLLRWPELRLLLRRLAADRLRRRGRARLHHGRLHALHRAGLPRAARLARRWPLALRRAGCRLRPGAPRPFDRCAAARRRGASARRAAARAGPESARGRHALHAGAAALLSRWDQHVAWRGDAPPADPLALIDRIRGAAVAA